MADYLCSGAATMSASTVVHPIELIKTRMQINQSTRMTSLATSLLKEEGVRGFYSGLSASLLRQATYGSTRLGLHRAITSKLKEHYSKTEGEGYRLPVYMTVGSSMFAACCGVMVGNPFDLSLVRMQVDTLRPPAERKNYKHAVDAIVRVSREEGFSSLWNGALPTMGRAMAMNVGQLASYDVLKNFFTDQKIERPEYPAAFGAGVMCATTSLPFDYAKSQLQASGTKYKGLLEVMVATVQARGVLSLWTGYLPYLSRCGPHAVITLMMVEKLSEMFGKKK